MSYHGTMIRRLREEIIKAEDRLCEIIEDPTSLPYDVEQAERHLERVEDTYYNLVDSWKADR